MDKSMAMRSTVWGALLLAASGEPAAANSEQRVEAAAPVAAAVNVATPAVTAAKVAKAPPSQELLQQYMKALAKGREADGKGQLAEARKHFEAAVALLPEGGAAQSELGWVAYRLKDLKAAEQATRAAVGFSVRPSLRAGSLYNLGRILSDLGKKAEAVQAYKAAWELGQNPVTLAALKALDPGAAGAVWPSVKPMTGPMVLASAPPAALKQAACRIQLEWVVQHQTENDPGLTRETLNDPSLGERPCKLAEVSLASGGTLQKALVVEAGFSLGHYSLSTIGLWAQTRQGWFHEVVSAAESWKWYGVTAGKDSVQVVGNLVVLRTSSSQWHDSYGKEMEPPEEHFNNSDSYLHVLGVGPSGRPSLTAAIHLGTSREAEKAEKVLRSAKAECPVKLQPSGELQIGKPAITRNKMTEKEFSGGELRTPLGTFQLKYP
jgi:tetratricopeptide (TPR) repeat protein